MREIKDYTVTTQSTTLSRNATDNVPNSFLTPHGSINLDVELRLID